MIHFNNRPRKSLPVVKEQLVGIIMEQAVVISELQTITDELRQEIQRLRVSRDLE